MTTPPPNPRHTYTWTKLRKQRLAIGEANQEHCNLCGRPIDYTLTHRSGMSWEGKHPASIPNATTSPCSGSPILSCR